MSRVLVTGGTSGLGAALAAAFLARGDDVIVADINEPAVGFETPQFIRLDVRSDDDWVAAREWVAGHWGRLDVLVNNAGVAGGGRIDVSSMDEWQWITEINLFGVVRGTRTFVPMFKQQRSGHIVNIASLAGLVHPAGMGSYNAVKAGVVAFSETMSHELAEYDVHCSVVCPSYFRTKLIEHIQADRPAGSDAAVGNIVGGLVAEAPLGPGDIAAAVIDGMDRGEELIIPDDAARTAYRLKLSDRPAYDQVMRKQAARLNATGGTAELDSMVPGRGARRPSRRAGSTEGDGLDGASEVRQEDSFDVEAVREWLAGEGTELTGEITLRQFGGGASNLTYSLRDDSHDLILRRPPTGQKAKGAHDMGREYRIQDGLADVFPLVPEMVALCRDESVIGSEFYVMQRVDGVIPRRDLPDGISLSEDEARTLCTNAIDVLIDLHQIDVDATPLASMNKGEGYVERQIRGWTNRFRDAHTEDIGDYEAVMAWLDEHQPKDVASCLIHNDFRFDNLVLDRDDPTRPVGVLDWEMATVGDPFMDLGGTLAYWVQEHDDEFLRRFRRQPTNLPGMLSREEVVAYYCDRTGYFVTPEQWRFYEVYGLFRLGVIAQQIYYRYFHGQTTNEAYEIFGPAAQHLEERCNAIIDQSGL